MTDAPLPRIDIGRLRDDLRANNEAGILQAYRMLFNTEAGRLVLAHHLMECGVGNMIVGATDAELREAVGRHNAAIDLAAKADFDQAAIAVGVITGHLEETQDEHSEFAGGYIPSEDDDFGD